MKKLIVVLIVMAFAATFAVAGVQFTEVMPASSHASDVTNDNGDWFEITNTGAFDVSLDGWSWVDDKSSHEKLVFPDVTLSAGQSLICLEENDSADWLSTWGLSSSNIIVVTEADFTAFHGLGAGGDSLNLYDSDDNLVDSFTWTSSNEGISFDILNGGESQVGVNGAWASNDVDGASDVASPGVVPEPTTFALLTVGVFAFTRRK